MKFPKWLNSTDTIGVAATSDGVTKELDQVRFQHGKKLLEQRGHQVVFAPHVFQGLETGAAADGKTRADELNQFARDPQVRAIMAAKGGVYLAEMLKDVDFEALVTDPKWIQGYSDNTGLLFTLTGKYDVATVYGANFGDFGMEPWQESVVSNYEVLSGKCLTQQSFAQYQDGFGPDRETGLEGYAYDADVCWKNGRGEKEITLKGRFIGGCADVLFFLAGTKYDGALDFCERYKEDGIIWYLESFLANDEDFVMQLWKLKEMGWFKYATGIVFGRPLMYQSWANRSYQDTVMYMLKELDIPIIFDADIGHKGPQMAVINGALGQVTCKDGKGSITYMVDEKGDLV